MTALENFDLAWLKIPRWKRWLFRDVEAASRAALIAADKASRLSDNIETHVNYLLFDLEATRRERDAYRKTLKRIWNSHE